MKNNKKRLIKKYFICSVLFIIMITHFFYMIWFSGYEIIKKSPVLALSILFYIVIIVKEVRKDLLKGKKPKKEIKQEGDTMP